MPVAGTSMVPPLNEKVHIDILVLGYVVALHALDLYSECSLLVLVCSKNPLEVWGASLGSWILGIGRFFRIMLEESP